MAVSVSLKPLDQQVIVTVGASSGMRLTTARMAARQGAKLVLAARDLKQLEQEINASGGQAVAVAADCGNQQDVERIYQTALDRFGGFDT